MNICFKGIDIKNRNFLLLCFIGLFQGLIFFVPIQTLFLNSRGVSLDNIYNLESILLISIMVFEIPWGWVADKTSYKTTLIIGYGISALGFLIMYISYGFEAFAIMMLIRGIAISGRSGVDTALLYHSIGENDGEKAYGIWQSFYIVGIMLSSIASGFISKFSIDLTVLITFFSYFVAFILCFFLKDVKRDADSNKKSSLKTSFKDIINLKEMIIFVLAITLFIEVCTNIVVYLNQLQYLKSGIAVEYFGIISAAAQVLGFFSYKVNVLTRKFGKRRVILAFIFLLGLSLSILISTSNWLLSIVFIIVVETISYMIYPIITDIENKWMKKDTKNRATILSIYSVLGSITSVIVNFIISRFSNNNLITSLIVCLIIIGFSFILIFNNKILKK